MDREDRKFLAVLACVVVGVFLLIGAIISPFVYMEGVATSNWLKQTRGVNIPWYEAALLDVKINDVDASVDVTEPR